MASKSKATDVGGVGIDLSDFYVAATALKKADPVAAKELRGKLRMVGEQVAHDYGYLIGPYSKSVEESIKVRIAGGLMVSVVSGGSGVPLAGLLELGGQGGASTWDHPVFGNAAVRVTQQTHPALGRAVEANIARVEGIVLEALDEAITVAVT